MIQDPNEQSAVSQITQDGGWVIDDDELTAEEWFDDDYYYED